MAELESHVKLQRFFGLVLQPCLGSWQCRVGWGCFGLQPAMVQLHGKPNAFGWLHPAEHEGLCWHDQDQCLVGVRGCFSFSTCLWLVVPSQELAVMVTLATRLLPRAFLALTFSQRSWLLGLLLLIPKCTLCGFCHPDFLFF